LESKELVKINSSPMLYPNYLEDIVFKMKIILAILLVDLIVLLKIKFS
jgi:hypothetical protein